MFRQMFEQSRFISLEIPRGWWTIPDNQEADPDPVERPMDDEDDDEGDYVEPEEGEEEGEDEPDEDVEDEEVEVNAKSGGGDDQDSPSGAASVPDAPEVEAPAPVETGEPIIEPVKFDENQEAANGFWSVWLRLPERELVWMMPRNHPLVWSLCCNLADFNIF